MTFPRSSLHRALGVALLAGALSCVDGPTAPRPLALVTATPEALSLRPLDSTTVVARVTTLDGAEIAGLPIEWRSLDTTIANVSATGVVTARAYTGPAIRNTAILVTSPGASTDTVPVEVLPWAVARVIASPASVTISPRDSAQLTLRLESEAGLELSDRTVAWIVDDTAMVQVNASGRARARLYTGPLTRQTWVVAFSEGQADSIRVTVPPLEVASITVSPTTTSFTPGQLDTLSAVVRTADGQALTETPLTWSSTDTTIARVNEEGVVTAMFYAGFETRVASIIVRFGSVADTSVVEVRPLAVSRLRIDPDTAAVRPNTTFLLGAVLQGPGSVVLNDRPVTWSSSDTSIAQVSDSGLITTRPYGGPLSRSALIFAASGGVADTLRLTVTPHPVFSIVVTPERLTMQPLDSAQLTPRLESLFGDLLSGRLIFYTSQNSTVVGVSPVGLVHAQAYTGDSVRTTTILVQSATGTAVDTIPVEILPFTVQQVVVTPSAVTLPPRGSDSLEATALSAAGLPLTGRATVWVSSDTSVVQVNAAGVITARPYFGPLERTVQVVAFTAGFSDTANVTVQPEVATSLQLSAGSVTLSPSAVDTLRAVLRTATSDSLTDFPLQWRSTDSTVAIVNAEGIVTARFYTGEATRTSSVIVSLGALSDTAVIVVAPLAVSSVEIRQANASPSSDRVYSLFTFLRDATGLLLSGRDVTWTLSDTSVASIGAQGEGTEAVARIYGGPDTRSVTVIAASEDVSDSLTLSWPPLPAFQVTATPEALTLAPLDTATVAVTALGVINRLGQLIELTGRTKAFTSLDTTVAVVDGTGRVTARAYAGPAVRFASIVVSVEGVTDTVPLTVVPLAIDRVVASPSAVTIPVGDSVSLSATTASADGTTLTDREFAWLSSDTSIVRVSDSGVATARPYDGPLERTAFAIVFSGGRADSVTVTVTPRSASSLEVTPASVSLLPGGVTTLGTAVRTAGGALLSDFPLTWTSTDTTVARVNVEGVVTASYYVGAATRTALIIVSTGSLADTSSLEVLPLAVASVVINPETGTLLPSATFQLDAALRDAEGLVLAGRITSWSSLSPAIASVSSSGLVSSSAFGGTATRTVQIVATSGSAADTVTLTIPPHPVAGVSATPEALNLFPLDSITVIPTVTALDLTVLSDRPLTWATLDSSVATVNAAGRVRAAAYTGPAVRNTRILVTSGSASDTIPVTVTPLAVARVLATPSAVTIAVGDSTTLTAVTESANGTPLTAREFAWSSSDTSIMQVTAAGVVRTRPYAGPLQRSVLVVVFSGGVADTTTVTVTPLAAGAIEVTPASITLRPGAVDTLGTAVRTTGGTLLSGFPLTWSSSDTTVARVNGEGVVTASFYVGAATRNAVVIVSTGTLADTSLIEVVPLSVASVAITPDSGSLLPSGTFQLDAALRDAAGLLLVDRVTTWSSLEPAVATVNASGLVTASAFGGTTTRTARIVATSGGSADTVTLTLPPLAAAWLTATPEALSLQPLDSATISARVESLNFTELIGRAVSFASLDTTIVRVDASGRATAAAYTGPAVRSTSIVLASGAAVDTVPVTVTPLAIARVISSPSAVTVSVGDSTTVSASTESANGTALSAREFVWISSDTAVVQVTTEGLARARPYTGPLQRSALVVVFSGGVADTTTVTVTPQAAGSIELTPSSVSLLPSALDTLGAAVRTAGGTLLSGFPLTWTSTDTSVARVNVEGVVTAQFYVGAATRMAFVVVSTGALADTGSVEVLPLAVASVVLTPDVGTLFPSGTFQLDAALRDAAGLLLVDRVTTWTSLDPAVATVNTSGLVTATAFGGTATRSARIVGTSGGVADTATLTLPPLDAAWLTATPEALSLQPLDTASISARVESLNFTELVGRAVSFAPLDTTIVRVDASGRATAAAYTGPTVRSTSIVLTSGAASDTVPVTITPLSIARVIATPSTVTVAVGDSATLSAVTESANGTGLSARDFVWISSDTAVVQVTTAGLVRTRPYAGPLERTALVVVFSGGVADTTAVTVTPLSAGTVQVTPSTVSTLPGGVTTLSADVRTAGGALLVGFPLSWTSSDTTVARVNAEGVVTASFYVGAATRTTTVIVATGALADTSSFEVLPLLVDSVAITPETGTVLPSGTFQLDIALRDAAGLLLVDRVTTWTSLDPVVATVNASGLVTASAFGGTATRTARIVATSGGVADTATLTLPPLDAAWLTATPEALSLQPLDTATITTRVESLNFTELSGRAVTFASLDTTVARVNAGGQVTAAAYTGPNVRSTAIVLASGAAVDTVPVSITPLAIARVIATPNAVTLTVGDSTTFSAVPESANGTALSAREFVWISNDTAVVQVTATGLVRTRPYTGPLQRSALVVVFSGGVADTSTVTVTPLAASSIAVTPTSVSLLPGARDTLDTAVRTAGGELLTGFPLTWSSSDTTVARVNVEGIVTASFYVGAATRTASVAVTTGALADTSIIEVLPLAVASVAIAPDSGSLLPSGTFQLDAALRDAASLLLVDRITTWSSLDPAVATVNGSGLVTATAFGGTTTRTARIVATSGGVADTVTLTLPPLEAAWITATPEALTLQPLDTATVTSRVESSNLTELTGRTVSFSTLDPSVATVDAEGKVTAIAYTGPTVRFTSIVLTSGAATDTVPVTVTPLAIARVISTPSAVTLTVGDSTTLSAVTESSNGTPLSAREIVWQSSDTTIVSATPEGRVRTRPYAGPLERTAQIVVYSGGVADTTTVTVTPLSAGAVQVTPSSVSLLPGGVTTLGAEVRTAGGDLLTGFPLTWTSTDSTVASVNVEGIVTGRFYVGAATRNALIIVATGALADTSSIEVLPLAVDSVAISPDTGTLLPSATFQLDVALRDAGGLLLVDRTTTWSSLNPTVATVSASGLVTAAAFGGTSTRTAQIVASSGGVADTITLTVSPHSVAAVTATPEALSLVPLDTATVTPTITALDLTVLTGRTVTWASLDDAVATVDVNGLVTATAFTGPALRSTAIIVTSATATDTVPVTVAPMAVARVIASPASVTLAPEATTTLSVSLESLSGTVLSARDRLWLSADTSIATVDSLTGLVTARPYAGPLERTVDIVVYSEGKADTVAVTITALTPVSLAIAPDSISIIPGEQSTLSAILRSSSDTVLVGRPVTWTSTDPTLASVNADGVVTALFYVGPDERTVGVTAVSGVLADTALIRIRALLVDSIAIFPDTQTLQPDQEAQLSAVLRDSAGLFLSGRNITWSSSDTTRATVTAGGLVRTRASGTVTITATSGGISAQATITIALVVASVRVTPELATVWIGRTQPLVLAIRDTNGVTPAGRRVTWTSSDPTRATVDSLGVVTAISTGLVVIRATSEGLTDSVRLDVFPEPTAAVTISFDDSWRGVLELAYPVMQDLRLRANVGWITSVNWAGVMTPTELRVLQDGGWSIVSHSMTHPYLTQLTADSAAKELTGSRARIDSLGFDPRVFIAPYLDYNNDVLLASAAAGYTYTRCCAEDTWSTDTLVSWPIQPAARHRLAGVDVTNYDGQTSSYNFRTVEGRDRLRQLLNDVVAEGKFLDVFFHDVLPEDVPDLRLTMEILAQFRPYLITYAMLP